MTGSMARTSLLTAQQVADWTALSSAGIRRMTRRGQVPGAVNVGTTDRPAWRYDPQQVAAWMCAR